MKKNLQNLERIRQEREEKATRECTFKPKINGHVKAQSKVFEIETYEEKMKRYERMKKERELEEATSRYEHKRPSSAYATRDNYDEERRPIYERVGQIQMEIYEKEKLRKQQQYEEERKLLRSAPLINEESKRMVDKMKDRVPFTSRTHKMGEEDEQTMVEREKLKRRYVEVRKEEMEDCTFKPEVNEVSKKLTEMRGRTTFLERQQMYKAREKKKQEMLAKREDAQHTFKPSISKTSDEICKANRGVDIYDRLTNRDKKRMDFVKDAIAQEYYSKFSFQPQINQISSVIAAPTGLTELVNNTKSKKVKEELVNKVLEKENYSFQPKLISENDKYLQDRKPLSVMKEPEKFLKRKDMKIAKAVMEMECEQLQECTFQPTINTSCKTESDAPIVIKGLGKHIERGERAKRIQEEKKERHDEVFRPKVYSKKLGGATIIEPFCLTKSK